MDHTTVVPKFFKDEVRIIFTKLTKEQVEKMTEALNILAVSREPEDKVIDLMELLNDLKV
jgi:stress response protein YsnF